MAFQGKRVLALESRRAVETAELIRRQGGDPFIAPSIKEVPVEENQAALDFADRLMAGEFEMVILLTGVGTRFLHKLLEPVRPGWLDALRRVAVVVRGPKPAAVLRDLNVPVAIFVPEPNTWREVLAALDGRPEKRIAVQEYGVHAEELVKGLQARGAQVTSVPVYQYALPDDRGPLEEAVRRLHAGEVDVCMFTSSAQIYHLLQVGNVVDALNRTFVASIGPTTSETLREHGIRVDMEPSHPKLGILVKEAAERL